MPGNTNKRSHGARAAEYLVQRGLAVDGDGALRHKKPGAYNPAAVGLEIVRERQMASARGGHFQRTVAARQAAARAAAAKAEAAKVAAAKAAAAAASPDGAAAAPGGGSAEEADSTPKASRVPLVVYEDNPEYVESCRRFQAQLEAAKAAEVAKKAAAAEALVALSERRQTWIAKFSGLCKRLLPRLPHVLREVAIAKVLKYKLRLAALRKEIEAHQSSCIWSAPWTLAPDAMLWGWGDLAVDRVAEVKQLEDAIKVTSKRTRALSFHPLLKFTPPAIPLAPKLSRREAEAVATAAAVEEITRLALPDYLVAAEEGDTTGCTAIVFKNLRECRGKEQLIRAHKDLTALIEGMRCRLAAKQGVYIKTDHRDKSHSTGVAFVNFATTEDCHKCMASMRAQEGGVWLYDAATNTERQLMPEFSMSSRKTSAQMATEAKAKAAAKVKEAGEAEARKAAVRAAMAGDDKSTSRTPVAPITGRAGKTAFTVVAAAGAAPKLAPVNLGATARKRKAEAEAARMAQVKAEFEAMFAPSLTAAAVAPSKPNRTQLAVSFKQVVAIAALPAPAPYVPPPTLEEDLEAGRICGPSHPDWQKQQNLLRRRAITHKAELMVAAAVPFEGYAAGEAEKKVKGLIKAAAGSKVFTPFRG